MDSDVRKTVTNLQEIDHDSDDSDEFEDKENNTNSQNTVDLTSESKNEKVSTCNKIRYDLRKRNASNQQVPKKAKKRPRTKVPLAKYQNPDRLLYHVKTNLPIKNDEPEAEECYEWLRQLSLRQIDDFVDLNEGEKAFMKLWNTHLHYHPCYGDKMLIQVLEGFIDEYGFKIHKCNLQNNFTLHLSNLHEFEIISSATMLEMITRYQKLVKNSLEDENQNVKGNAVSVQDDAEESNENQDIVDGTTSVSSDRATLSEINPPSFGTFDLSDFDDFDDDGLDDFEGLDDFDATDNFDGLDDFDSLQPDFTEVEDTNQNNAEIDKPEFKKPEDIVVVKNDAKAVEIVDVEKPKYDIDDSEVEVLNESIKKTYQCKFKYTCQKCNFACYDMDEIRDHAMMVHNLPKISLHV